MNITRFALPVMALGAAAFLVVPAEQATAFSKIGGALGVGQRDFRVFNNFSDSASNNNTTPNSNFPGWLGAEMAIWKAGAEWNSGSHGDGSGDPLQGNVGDGGANFDFFWAGAAAGIGSSDANVVSAIGSCSGGTLAYAETPISNGWRIRFCDNWVWHDGPGDNPTGGSSFDMQGVGCHELGHALGLGHSGVFSATMYASTSSGGSSNARSIASDDQAGVQCIYSPKGAAKPDITSLSISGNVLTIVGSNFSATGNEVWFTNKNVTTGSDPRVRVTGVTSSGGGTQLSVSIPANAGTGAVLVKNANSGNASLSRTMPFDPGGTGGTAPSISSVVPSTVENLIPGTAETVTINGANFTPTAVIKLDGNVIAGSSSYVDANTLTFEWEPVSALGARTLTVETTGGMDSTSITVVANALPTLQAGNGDPLNLLSGSAPLVMGGQPGDLHYVMVSTSSQPSVLPGKINLGMGNVFQELFEVGLFQMGPNGTASTSVPLTNVSFTFLYWQSLDIKLPLAANYPLQESNLQSTFVQ